MSVSPTFKAAVNDGDAESVKMILKNSLVVDPTAADFDDMLRYAKAQAMPGLFDPHDGEALRQDSVSWTKEYMDEQMVNVVDNFSKERVGLLKDICRHLYRDKVKEIEVQREHKLSDSDNVEMNRTQRGHKRPYNNEVKEQGEYRDSVSPTFRAAVKDGDAESVRMVLKNSLIVDPTAADFDKMLRYAKDQSMPRLFDPHNGEVLREDLASWTKEYMDEQMVNVVDNFSRERVGLLKDICRHIYRDKVEMIEDKRAEDARANSSKECEGQTKFLAFIGRLLG